MGLFIPTKTDGENVQYEDLRNGQSNALNSLLYWFLEKKGCGSTLQKDLVVDKFSTDNVVKSQNMRYVTGGSYQCVDYGSTFMVLLECGSVNQILDFSINGCKAQQISNGSYMVYGPNAPTLGSSRSMLMKTLFYGTIGTDYAIGSNRIVNISGIKVLNNDFDDVGKRAYNVYGYGTYSGYGPGAGYSHVYLFGSFENGCGSVHSWSNCHHTNTSGFPGNSEWYLPSSISLNVSNNAEIGLDLSTDIKINPGSFQIQIYFIDNTGDSASFQGSVHTIFLTTGSLHPATKIATDGTWSTNGSTLIDFKTIHNVPVFGSVGNEINFGSCYVVTKPWLNISGSVDTIIGSVLGSFSSNTVFDLKVSVDNEGSYTNFDNGILGSINSVTNTGSMCFKIGLNRTGSTSTDYINGYGGFYG